MRLPSWLCNHILQILYYVESINIRDITFIQENIEVPHLSQTALSPTEAFIGILCWNLSLHFVPLQKRMVLLLLNHNVFWSCFRVSFASLLDIFHSCKNLESAGGSWLCSAEEGSFSSPLGMFEKPERVQILEKLLNNESHNNHTWQYVCFTKQIPPPNPTM